MHKNLAISHVIASVLSSDGEIHDSEKAFLEEAMVDLGLTDEEKWDVLAFKNDGAEEVVKNLPREDKEFLRDGLLQATLVDGKITEQEREVVKAITDLMGL